MSHQSTPRRRPWPALRTAALLAIVVAPVAGAATLADGGPVDLGDGADIALRLDGAAAGDIAGRSIAPAGDFNGDGAQDLIVGAPGGGVAHVVFGGDGIAGGVLGGLGAGEITISGEPGGAFGQAVAAAGDVNDDGIDDVIVGDPDIAGANGADAGRAYVIYGSATPGDTAVAGLSPATTGFRIEGAAANQDAGTSVAGAGDVDGDGVDDVVVGSEQVGSTATTGRADLVRGTPDGGTPAHVDLAAPGAAAVTFTGGSAGDAAGAAVAPAGDVNDDGRADLAIGAPGEATGGANAGAAYVVLGSAALAGGALGSLAPGAAFSITGGAAGDRTGAALWTAGDVNADGIDDLIVGSPEDTVGAAGQAGSAAVIFGEAGPADVSLGALGAKGVLLTGGASGDKAGFSVGGGSDVNGDGVSDVVVAASEANSPAIDAGRGYLVFGSAGLSTIALESMGTAGARIDGAIPGDSIWDVALAQDVTGDKKHDVLLGSPLADNNGSGSGSAYVVAGFSVSTVGYPTTALDGGASVSLAPTVTANGTATFAASGLPPGLAIDAATGRISGAPTAAGVFNATVTVSDATGANPVPITFTVASGFVYPTTALTLDAPLTLAAAVGASGTPSFSASGLPPGLGIDPVSGTISGTPDTIGSYSATVTMVDANGSTARSLTFTVGLPSPDGTPAPSARAGAYRCSGRTLEFRRSARGVIRVSRRQLLTNQRIAQAAIRRLNAIESWLNTGVRSRDLCGHSIGGVDLASGVSAVGGGLGFSAEKADPRPLKVGRRRGDRAARVRLSRSQLVVNQRVYQVALLRARALKKRLARLTGGDLRDGAVTAGKLVPGTRILSATSPARPIARSRTDRVTAKRGAARNVRLTKSQLVINQAIARRSIQETNELRAILVRGLTGKNFRDATIDADRIEAGAITG